MNDHRPLRIENAIVGEDVIVVKPNSPMHDKIGQVWKSGHGEPQKVSVSFEGEIYNFNLEDLILA